MKNTGRRRALLLLAPSLFPLLEAARLGLSAALNGKERLEYMKAGLALNPSDAEFSFGIGRLYHLLMLGDEGEARRHYVQSLEHNPLLTSSWLALAEMYIEEGKDEKARASLLRAFELAPLSMGRLWESSILALRLGDVRLAARALKAVAKSDDRRRMRVYDISWQLISDPAFILREIVTDEALPSYLSYLMSKDKLGETFPVWERMERVGSIPQSVALAYVDYLVNKGRVNKASSIWEGIKGKNPSGSIVWDGGFESKPTGVGFDWRIYPVEGVKIGFDYRKRIQGRRSLRLEFDGRTNVDFQHVYQLVPVEPESDYVLSYNVAAEGITTRNGVSVELYCYPGGSMAKASRPVTGSSGWKAIEIPFHTPSDCNSVVIRLRRYRSDKLDRYIAGTFWIDGVEINRVQEGRDDQNR